MSSGLSSLKALDVLVMSWMAVRPEQSLQVQIANGLEIAQSQVSNSLKRLANCGLYDAKRHRVRPQAFWEFLVFGLKYVHPARRGPRVRGIPTAHSGPWLSSKLAVSEDDVVVWPSSEGQVIGESVEPVWKTMPAAARRDPDLHDFLSMLDALRIGRARERKLAADEIARRLGLNARAA